MKKIILLLLSAFIAVNMVSQNNPPFPLNNTLTITKSSPSKTFEIDQLFYDEEQDSIFLMQLDSTEYYPEITFTTYSQSFNMSVDLNSARINSLSYLDSMTFDILVTAYDQWENSSNQVSSYFTILYINDLKEDSVFLEGCTNSQALNYNPNATYDNGTCYIDTILGCTDTLATNYNSDAMYDDGSCIIDSILYGCTSPEASNYNPSALINDGSCQFDSAFGCTNPNASNYDPTANYDNGSCIIDSIVYGCTNSQALNYNPNATYDNGTCYIDTIFGCTDTLANNYNSDAMYDDGSCVIDSVLYGCTYPGASNYNPSALINDGSCQFDSAFGCTNPNASNYDPTANYDNGSCIIDSISTEKDVFGCTDYNAINFNSDATLDNGTCNYSTEYTDSIFGCTDVSALNYNASATDENGSCIFTQTETTISTVLDLEEIIGDTLTSSAINDACDIDFSSIIDSVIITDVSVNRDNIEVEWTVWQQNNAAIINSSFGITSDIDLNSAILFYTDISDAGCTTSRTAARSNTTTVRLQAIARSSTITGLFFNYETVNQIEIIPNPVRSSFNVNFNNNISQLEILDANGAFIQNSTNTTDVEVKNLTPGIYFLLITDENGNVYSEKFVKQ